MKVKEYFDDKKSLMAHEIDFNKKYWLLEGVIKLVPVVVTGVVGKIVTKKIEDKAKKDLELEQIKSEQEKEESAE